MASLAEGKQGGAFQGASGLAGLMDSDSCADLGAFVCAGPAVADSCGPEQSARSPWPGYFAWNKGPKESQPAAEPHGVLYHTAPPDKECQTPPGEAQRPSRDSCPAAACPGQRGLAVDGPCREPPEFQTATSGRGP